MSADAAADALVEVLIVDLPVQVWADAQEHADELIREFTLIARGLDEEPDGENAVPAQLLDLVEKLTAEYGGLNTDQENELVQAAKEGIAVLDLTFNVPPMAAEAAAHLGDMLDAADEYCRAGQHLLTLATPPDALAFRQWYLAEFGRQVAGEPPMSWPAWLESTRS